MSGYIIVNQLVLNGKTVGYRFSVNNDSGVKSCDMIASNSKLFFRSVLECLFIHEGSIQGSVKNGVFTSDNTDSVVEISTISEVTDFLSRYYSGQEVGLSIFKNNKIYGGVTNKYGITICETDIIVKGGSSNSNNTSVFSEYVASKFINSLGYTAHNTFLSFDNGEYVVLLEDFTTKLGTLIHFEDIGESSEDTDLHDKGYTYEDVVYLIRKHTKIPESLKDYSVRFFWDMFMLDAVLGNRDRHKGNWGYVGRDGVYGMAPLYDNGNSLFPNVLSRFKEYKIDKVKFLLERSEMFPASVLKEVINGVERKTNFYRFISEENLAKYPEMSTAYSKMKSFGYKRIFEVICGAVDNVLIPADLQKFYVEIVCCRYAHIIQRVPLSDIRNMLLTGFPWNLGGAKNG